MFGSQMLQPVIFPSESPLHPIFLLRFQSVSAIIMRTKVFNGVIVDAVDVPFYVFWGWETFIALLAFRRADVVCLMPAQER